MKRQRTPTEIAVAEAAGKRTWLAVLTGLAAGVVVALLSGEFVLLHCIICAVVGASGGMTLTRATLPLDPNSARASGGRGGLIAALGYALPFVAVAIYNYATLDQAKAAQLLAALSSQQVAQAQQNFIAPGSNPLEYFRGQYISYAFGYPLAGVVVGWLFGLMGGAFMRANLRGRHGA